MYSANDDDRSGFLAFPQGFKVPQDQGGPGQGKPIGGFGGDPSPSKSRDEHRDAGSDKGALHLARPRSNITSGSCQLNDLQTLTT